MAHLTTKTYFEQRLTALGIPPEDARRYGLDVDEHGNIIQYIRGFTGKPVKWLDKRGRNAKRLAMFRNRKTGTEGTGEEQFLRPLSLIRYTPENLERIRRRHPEAGKYKYPSKKVTGYGALPMPTVAAIDAFNGHKTGGVGVGIEGYFKAVALAVNGVEATAFTGNTTYKLEGMEEYFLRRRLDDFVIMYDGDALQLSDNQPEVVSSKRVVQFYNSAIRFAEQFTNFCQRHGLKTRIHFCVVRPTLPWKGADDVLAAHTPEERRGIIDEWRTLKTGPHFQFLRLGKTNYKRRLDEFFGMANHVEFYRRHGRIIGRRAFSFGGAVYQPEEPERHFNLMESHRGHLRFRALFNPFAVEMNAEQLSVGEWMAEASAAIDNILHKHNKVCIEAPTGTGKTSYFLGHKANGRRVEGYFRRTGVYGVVAVPTVMLAKQLAAKYRVPSLHGFVSPERKEKAINAPVVVCTYDTLHHVTDLHRRVLVVDEAHNMVNQYGDVSTGVLFRGEVLRRVVESFDTARQTVMISGTPPELLAKLLGFHYVAIHRRKNNAAHVYGVEATSASYKQLTTATVAQLEKLPWDDGRIHFVYYNHTDELEKIRRHLVDSGTLQPEQIHIITRHHVNTGEHRIFNEIVADEEITSDARLILSTCIIAEGVNINNTNVGNIYAVNVRCEDSFRQYVARFRKMERVNVYSIRPPERRVDGGFMYPAEREATEMLAMAAEQCTVANQHHRQYMAEYTTEELAFWNDGIKPQYHYRPRLFDWIFQPDEDEEPRVDILRICAAIRERKMNGMNNAYFYTRIGEHPNIIVEGAEPVEDTSGTATALEATTEAMAADKDSAMEMLRHHLTIHPEVVVSAYHQHATETNNRHAVARVEAMAADLLSDDVNVAATEFVSRHGELFRHRWFTAFIGAFLRLHAIGVGDEVMAAELAGYSKREFTLKWRRFTAWMEFEMYANKRHRLALKTAHKAEIKAHRMAAEWITAAATDGRITSTELVELLNAKFKRRRLNSSLDGVEEHTVVRFDSAAAERLLTTLFRVDVELYRGYREYTLHVEDEPPFTGEVRPRITTTPVEFLKFF